VQAAAEPGRIIDHRFLADRPCVPAVGAPFNLEQYALAWFLGLDFDPTRVFGKMTCVKPHQEEAGGAVLVPVELRSIYDEQKTWEEVHDELGELCEWSREVYGYVASLT